MTVLSGIGMAGYYAGPEVHIVDELALGDPLLSHLRLDNISDWRLAHFRRNIPEGYLESLESGKNKITDPALAKYYDKLTLITRGDIWSLERWEAIWKMNTGQYDYLIEAYMKSQP